MGAPWAATAGLSALALESLREFRLSVPGLPPQRLMCNWFGVKPRHWCF